MSSIKKETIYSKPQRPVPLCVIEGRLGAFPVVQADAHLAKPPAIGVGFCQKRLDDGQLGRQRQLEQIPDLPDGIAPIGDVVDQQRGFFFGETGVGERAFETIEGRREVEGHHLTGAFVLKTQPGKAALQDQAFIWGRLCLPDGVKVDESRGNARFYAGGCRWEGRIIGAPHHIDVERPVGRAIKIGHPLPQLKSPGRGGRFRFVEQLVEQRARFLRGFAAFFQGLDDLLFGKAHHRGDAAIGAAKKNADKIGLGGDVVAGAGVAAAVLGVRFNGTLFQLVFFAIAESEQEGQSEANKISVGAHGVRRLVCFRMEWVRFDGEAGF